MRNSWKNIQDCISGGNFRIETQVRINIAGYADVAMSQRHLNIFEAHYVSIQQTMYESTTVRYENKNELQTDYF